MIDAPWNTTVPASVVWNLYYMSDHLPIYMEIEVQKISNSIPEILNGMNTFYNREADKIQFQFQQPIQLDTKFLVYDLSGKIVQAYDFLNSDNSLSTAMLDTGMYILRLEKYDYSMKFIKD